MLLRVIWTRVICSVVEGYVVTRTVVYVLRGGSYRSGASCSKLGG